MRQFVATNRHIAFLRERRINTHHEQECRLSEGHIIFLRETARIEPYATFIVGSGFCSMGSFSYSWSEMFPDVVVGRYCCIAHDVKFMGGWHPMRSLSTSSMFYDRQILAYRDAQEDFGVPVPVRHSDETPDFPVIEHDVWIGQGALIGRGITIGTGAVIAAGSVVTKSVEPYSVVAGNPARHVRYRFDEALCRELLESRWWRFALPQFADLDFSDPRAFLHQLRDREEDMAEFSPLPTLGSELIAL